MLPNCHARRDLAEAQIKTASATLLQEAQVQFLRDDAKRQKISATQGGLA